MDVIDDVAVVGPGAVGTTVAAYLSAAGHPVRVCGRTPRSQIELRPDGADPITVPRPVCTDPAEIAGPVGVVLLAVKATQNADAARWLARLCDENTIVIVLQNGVEQVEQVQPLCASSTVIPGIVWFSAETQPDGWVRLRGEARLALPTGPAATAFADLWRAAGGSADCDPDFVTAAWRKLLVNAVAGLMVLTGRRSGMFRRDDLAALARAYAARMPRSRSRRRGPAGRRRRRRHGGDVPRGARRHGHLDARRPRSPSPAGVGHPQRGDHPQGARPRNRDTDQRHPGAATGRGQRWTGLAAHGPVFAS